eukprot:2767146-Amphidinium_carterae.1
MKLSLTNSLSHVVLCLNVMPRLSTTYSESESARNNEAIVREDQVCIAHTGDPIRMQMHLIPARTATEPLSPNLCPPSRRQSRPAAAATSYHRLQVPASIAT